MQSPDAPTLPRSDAATLLLAGPTAVGKSEVAILLAQRIAGEIVSVDSMQVYRGMNIGTAKPSSAERALVLHHLIDVVEIGEPFDAAQFARRAHTAVAEIQARGRVPILCGGTGFYFKAFLHGLGEAPASNATLRSELESTPLSDLLCELEKCDPQAYEKIDRQNARRVIRALEVIRLTGKPFSAQRANWEDKSCNPQPATHSFALIRSPADLYGRIDQRVDKMFGDGLVAETERLLERGLNGNRTAMQALGYRQVIEYLRGVRSLPETIELVKKRTRQFAKRQMTWFRGRMDLTWVAIEPAESAEVTVDRMLRNFPSASLARTGQKRF